MAAFGSIQVGVDILRTTLDAETKSIIAQTGDVQSEEVDSDNVEWWQQPGFCSRPAKAIPQKSACQGVILRQSDHDVCIAARDTRGQDIYGSLKDGETCLYAAGEDGKGQARMLLKGDGSMAMFSRTSADAKGMGVFLDPASDTIRITNAAGHGILINADGVFITTAGGASGLSLAVGGEVKLIATGACTVDGTSIALGGSAAPTTPALCGLTGIAGVASTRVFVSLA